MLFYESYQLCYFKSKHKSPQQREMQPLNFLNHMLETEQSPYPTNTELNGNTRGLEDKDTV